MFCTNCGNVIESTDKFCCKCGAAVAAVEAAPVAPVEAAPVEVAPIAPVEVAPAAPVCAAPAAPVCAAPAAVATVPVVSAKDKVFGFVGMGLSIGALVLAVIGILYTMIGMEVHGVGFGISFVFGMFTMPMCILGRMFCNKSVEAGNTSAACSVGAKLGLAALIVSCVMLFLGFVNLMDF